jgi:hypothetical protein
MKAHRRQLGRFSNSCALVSSVQGGFLRKKPLIIVHSVYSNWRTAITSMMTPTKSRLVERRLAKGMTLPSSLGYERLK